MKKKLLSVLFISSLLAFNSCGEKKGGRNDLSETEKSENSESKGLIVTLEGVFPTNDSYQLFYSNSEQFDEKKSIQLERLSFCYKLFDQLKNIFDFR